MLNLLGLLGLALTGASFQDNTTVDSFAVEVMERSVKATRAIKSVECTLIVQMKTFYEPTYQRTEKFRLFYAGPRRFAVRQHSISADSPEDIRRANEAMPPLFGREVVADDRRYFASSMDGTRSLLRPLTKEELRGKPLDAGAFTGYTFGDILFNGGKPYLDLVRRNGKYRGKEAVDGEMCHRISYDRGNEVWISTKDWLLRKAETKWDPPTTAVEKYTFRKLNEKLPQSEFRISPPARSSRQP